MELIEHKENKVSAGLQPTCTKLFYYITYRCNLRCKHCYIGNHLLSEKDASLQDIKHWLKSYENAGTQEIILLGGEPTLHPNYHEILVFASTLNFKKITIDTNALANEPVPESLLNDKRLAVRIGVESYNENHHNTIRNKEGAFSKVINALEALIKKGIKTEITITLNRNNWQNLAETVAFFESLSVSEINFHYISVIGNAQDANLSLLPWQVLQIQDELREISKNSNIPIRFPWLLTEIDDKNCTVPILDCRIISKNVHLLFPDNSLLHCPLQIHENELVDVSTTNSCPLAHKMFLELPTGYFVNCISNKEHV